MGPTQFKWTSNGKSQSHLWNAASTPRKKIIFVSNCDGWRKMDLFWKPEAEKIVAFTWRSRSINTKAKSLRQEDHALCLVGPERCCVLWTLEARKDDRNGPEDMAKWFCYTTMRRLTQQNQWKTPWNRLDGTSFRTRRTPQTWRHLTITSSRQWGTRSQSSTSAISRKLENGSTNGLPQKTSSFSGMVFINYLKDGRNV